MSHWYGIVHISSLEGLLSNWSSNGLETTIRIFARGRGGGHYRLETLLGKTVSSSLIVGGSQRVGTDCFGISVLGIGWFLLFHRADWARRLN